MMSEAALAATSNKIYQSIQFNDFPLWPAGEKVGKSLRFKHEIRD